MFRSTVFGYGVAGVVVIATLPAFQCLPPWADVTLYDVAARNILNGGTHYRDVFDTNLPGMPWAMVVIRGTCGWSYEILRMWDVVIVGTAVGLLAGWLRKCCSSPSSIAWFVSGITIFYLLTSEFCHCQRDPWMLLPAVLAARMRLCQLERSSARLFVPALIEGLVWGVGVWLKPHVLIPAAAVWIGSAAIIMHNRGWRGVILDAMGVFCGGVLAGVPGVLWLIATGAWPSFVEIFLHWNPEYMAITWAELPERLRGAHEFFSPWGYLHFVAVPVSLLFLWRVRDCQTRGLLAAFYLGWLIQAILLQRGLDYVRVPDTILALAVLAATRWTAAFVSLVWVLGLISISNANPEIVALWPRCVQEGSTPALRDRLGHYVDVHCGTKWTELNEVANYLRAVDPPIGERELNCWHDSTHPLYLMLDLQPATRYMHYGTVFPITSQRGRIRRDIVECPQRYVVSDLRRMSYNLQDAYTPGATGPTTLPAWFPLSQRRLFPWNQPIVFRSGRYLVHRIDRVPRPDEIDIPDWNTLDALGPGEQHGPWAWSELE